MPSLKLSLTAQSAHIPWVSRNITSVIFLFPSKKHIIFSNKHIHNMDHGDLIESRLQYVNRINIMALKNIFYQIIIIEKLRKQLGI